MVLFRENFEDYIEQTLPHEIAHAFVRHQKYSICPSFDDVISGRYRRSSRPKPHGSEWKRVMLAFGKTPSRCHSYEKSPTIRH